jgi:hypothetical protein
MTIRSPLVLGADGLPQQLQPGDVIAAPTTAPSLNAVTNGESATALVFGTPTYFSASDSVKRAQANAKSTSRLAGLVYDASISAGAIGNIATSGVIVGTTTQWDAVTGQTGGLSFGADYFLDAATPGKLTTTAPNTAASGQCNTFVGRGGSPTEFELNFELPILL